jgi:eukaryotic-like serine/threonine-protein kinase
VTPLARAPVGAYMHPRLSPDGRRLVAHLTDSTGNHLVVIDALSGEVRRVPRAGEALVPTWLDARTVLYRHTVGGRTVFARIAPDDSSPPNDLLAGPGLFAPTITPDGRTVLFQRGSNDAWQLWQMRDDGSAVTKLAHAHDESTTMAEVSPDGRWLAYVRSVGAGEDVMVRPVAGPGDPRPVSIGGGTEPRWAPHGRALFYRHGDEFIEATVGRDAPWQVSSRRTLFTGRFDGGMPHRNYDISRDGKSIYAIALEPEAPTAVVAVNWIASLRARLQATRP